MNMSVHQCTLWLGNIYHHVALLEYAISITNIPSKNHLARNMQVLQAIFLQESILAVFSCNILQFLTR